MHLKPLHLNPLQLLLQRLVGPELAPLRRMLVVLLWLAVLAIVLAGCTTQGPLQGASVGGELARGVDRYCALPRGARELAEFSISQQIEPHRLLVICAGDGEPEPVVFGGGGWRCDRNDPRLQPIKAPPE